MTEPNTNQKYRTILLDPPWPRQSGEPHYNTMPIEQIAAMPVGDLAADDAHLWMWVTNGTLRAGYDVAEAYGFQVRSPLTWVKFRLGLSGRHGLRNATEHLLFATRGEAPVQFRSQPTWVNAPVQDHSHKPEEFYPLIERVSPGPYLELFARRHQPGWDAWGNQIDSDIEIPGYPVPTYRKRRAATKEVDHA